MRICDLFFQKSERVTTVMFAAFGAIAGIVVLIGISVSAALGGNLSEVGRVFDAVQLAAKPTMNTVGGDTTVSPPPELIPAPSLPVLRGEALPPDSFGAKSIVVKDDETGILLYRKNEYERRPIASLTKLMSALVLLEQSIDWQKKATVAADEVSDTHMYAGDTYTLDDLWHAALIGSSNKAVLTLVDASGLTRDNFVARMNEKAKELGMFDANFVEPTGLDDNNKASAADVAILLTEALRQEKIVSAVTMHEYNLYSPERKQKHHIWNTDWLLLGWTTNPFKKIIGGKTGYIPESGYNFAADVVGDNGHPITIVALGAATDQSRFTDARDAGVWVYEHYEWPEKP